MVQVNQKRNVYSFTIYSILISILMNMVVHSTEATVRKLMSTQTIEYPNVRRNESVVEDYHGTQIPDVYRWLEDPESDEVKNFVQLQNNLTHPYLLKSPYRNEIQSNLTKMWNYPKYSVPEKHGDKYFIYMNTGLQNQNILYVQNSIDDKNPHVFLDPNTFSPNGTISISDFTQKFSINGKIFAYGLSKSGSDWLTIHFRNVITGQDYSDILTKVKFTSLSWSHDNLGIFYGAYPENHDDPGGEDPGLNENQKIFYHRIGTNQSQDIMVVEFPENPEWIVSSNTVVSDDGKYLIICPEGQGGTYGDKLLYFANIEKNITSKLILIPIVTSFNGDYQYVSNNNSLFYFRTNRGAPNYKLIQINLNNSGENTWKTIIEENKFKVLNWIAPIKGEKLIICYMEDVQNKLELRNLADGSFITNFSIDTGTVSSHSNGKFEDIFFFSFTSFLTSTTIFKINFTKIPYEVEVYKEVDVIGFDPLDYQTKQVFYFSYDGTRIPMFIVSKKNLERNSSAPVLLYGYGGFNINVPPSYSVYRNIFMKHFNGFIAIVNIRGGGEYGNAWHEGGKLEKKQNVFDDFQAGAEYLINENYTSASKLIIEGRSNGGLLVGACVNQRPELYGAALAGVGVMDMLRYQKFTIGHSWISEYGSSDNKEQFKYLIKYSPLHNIQYPPIEKNVQYPAVLVITSDHDDRVVPLHSYKYASELQHRIGRQIGKQTNPLLLRIGIDSGHGSGKPVTQLIEEYVDIFSFLVRTIGLTFQ